MITHTDVRVKRFCGACASVCLSVCLSVLSILNGAAGEIVQPERSTHESRWFALLVALALARLTEESRDGDFCWGGTVPSGDQLQTVTASRRVCTVNGFGVLCVTRDARDGKSPSRRSGAVPRNSERGETCGSSSSHPQIVGGLWVWVMATPP